MNVLCSFLTIYALLCSNVVVHLSDHNRGVMVAQVDYHNFLRWKTYGMGHFSSEKYGQYVSRLQDI